MSACIHAVHTLTLEKVGVHGQTVFLRDEHVELLYKHRENIKKLSRHIHSGIYHFISKKATASSLQTKQPKPLIEPAEGRKEDRQMDRQKRDHSEDGSTERT